MVGAYYGILTYNPLLWAWLSGLIFMIFMKEYQRFAIVRLLQCLLLTGVVYCFIGLWGVPSVGLRYLIPLILVLMTGILRF